MSYEESTPREAFEPDGFAPNTGLPRMTQEERVARTTSVAATTHKNGERLSRPLPSTALDLGSAALNKDAFWEDGLEPGWFRFTD